MGTVNEFLVVYLDSIDEWLLDYLDEDEELRLDTVQRLRFYTTALVDGSITPAAVAEDWPDGLDLAPPSWRPIPRRGSGSWRGRRRSWRAPRLVAMHRSPRPTVPIWRHSRRFSTCTPRYGPPLTRSS
jgi:hypothetical protein